MPIHSTTPEALAVFASGYGKRMMEAQYDRLMRSSVGVGALALPAQTRYGLEAALYALMAFTDARAQTNTALGRFFKEVALDPPPEIAKRLVNGARHDLEGTRLAASSDSERAVAVALHELDDATLARLAMWARTPANAAVREGLPDALAREMRAVTNAEGEKPNSDIDDPILDKAGGLNDWLVRARRRLRRGRAEQ